jgi:hypothetical protein
MKLNLGALSHGVVVLTRHDVSIEVVGTQPPEDSRIMILNYFMVISLGADVHYPVSSRKRVVASKQQNMII